MAIIGWLAITVMGVFLVAGGACSLYAMSLFSGRQRSDVVFALILLAAGIAVLYGAYCGAPFSISMNGGA